MMLTLRKLIDNFVLQRLPSERQLRHADIRLYVHAYFSPFATVPQHAHVLGLSEQSVRNSAARLIEHGWGYKVNRFDRRRGAVIIPWMPPELEHQVVAALAQVRTEIHFYGEWLMKNVLDLNVNERDVHDNSRPEWLTTPTGKRLELDRWYRRANVAFEFQGEQHSQVDGRFIKTVEQLRKRQSYDQLKRDRCADHDIKLIEVTAFDLSFDSLRESVQGKVELFPLREDSPLFRQLSGMCRVHVGRTEQKARGPRRDEDN